MYKIGIIVQLVMLLSFMSGCDRENVGELRRELEELEKQLKVLQSWQEKVNENLKTLQKLLEGIRVNTSLRSWRRRRVVRLF